MEIDYAVFKGAGQCAAGGKRRAIGEDKLCFDAHPVLQNTPGAGGFPVRLQRMDGRRSLIVHLPDRAEWRQLKPDEFDRLTD